MLSEHCRSPGLMLNFISRNDEELAEVAAILTSTRKVHGSNTGVTHNILMIFVVLSDDRGSSTKQGTISSSRLFGDDRILRIMSHCFT